jgi:hypothetical protein
MNLSSWGMRLAGFDATLALLQSLKFEFGDGVIYVAGPTVTYAVYHELGTSKMEARPFMGPAAERVQANLDTAIDQMIDVPLLEADEEELVRGAALAIQNEGKRIADAKDIRDTGALIASISIQKVA